MMQIILIVFGAVIAVSTMILLYEIKNAPLVGDTYLEDSYKHTNSDDTFQDTFCKHCAKNIDGLYCNNGVHLRKIGNEMINICRKESYFEVE